MNNFDAIAHIYDPLKRIVFGDSLQSVEQELINVVEIEGDVLVVGGGTGHCLTELPKNTRGNIHYVEKSSKMLRLASQRNAPANVKFHVSSLEEFDLSSYDVIITSFFLDVLNEETLELQIQRLYNSLKPGGIWLYADFQQPELFHHKLLLRSMFIFFRYFAALQSKKLLNHGILLQSHGLVNTYQTEVLSGFVSGNVYKKPILQGS